jgi:hypothetical protein
MLNPYEGSVEFLSNYGFFNTSNQNISAQSVFQIFNNSYATCNNHL